MTAVSIIVPHYEDLVGLDRCLTALTAQDHAVGAVEIIVADNRSPSGLAAVDQVVAGRARLIDAPERGAGPARNAAVSVARGAVLAFIDSDCVAEPGWLAGGLGALDRFDVVGGAVTVLVEPGRALTGAEAFERVFAFDNAAYVRDKGFTITANLFCARSTFDRTGPFAVGVSEDVDWCQRARAAGFTLGYAPAAAIGHPARADWPALHKKWRRINAEMFALAASQPGGRARWFARSLLIPLSIIAHAPRVVTSPALSNLGDRRRALGTLVRLRLWRFADALRLLAGGAP